MKHIVIPTDFSIRSLQLVKQLAEHYRSEQLHITLLHGIDMPTSIMDLLFIGKRDEYKELVNDAFSAGCEVIQNKYASVIRELKVQFLYGNSRRLVENFLHANEVDLVALPQQGVFAPRHTNSVDLLPLLKKCSKPIIHLPLQAAPAGVEQEMLADLLLAG